VDAPILRFMVVSRLRILLALLVVALAGTLAAPPASPARVVTSSPIA